MAEESGGGTAENGGRRAAGHFDAIAFTREVLASHGLTEWTVRWDHAKRRAGCCVHARREISLSRPLFALYSEETMRAVVLHEVAHALAGPKHQHDAQWKQIVRRLGAPDRARLPAALPSPEAAWVGWCPRCGKVKELHSMPRRVVSCGRCSKEFDGSLILRWTHNGADREPSGAYAREVKRLKVSRRGIGSI